MKKMQKFTESSEVPDFIQKKERKKKSPPKPLPPQDEIYEEDFEEFVEEPEKTETRPTLHNRPGKIPEYSIETLKKDLEEENAAALKREEQSEPSIIQPTTKNVEHYIDPMLIIKQQKRAKDISEFVKLEKESFSIFELIPSTNYDSLVNKVNKGLKKTLGTQSNEDNTDKEVQSQEILTKETGTQWPGDLATNIDKSLQISSLSKFLNKVSPMIEILLEENLTNKPNKMNIKAQDSNTAEILSQVSIPPIDFLQPRFPNSSLEIKEIKFFPTKKNLLGVLYNLDLYGSLIII